MKEVINIKKAPKPIGPYSQAILANGTLYVSGQIPVNPYTGQIVQGPIKDQTNQVLLNLQEILAQAQMDLSHVVKVSIFLKDMQDFSDVNEVYGTFFNDSPPARETVEVSKLPKDAGIEISLIAIK